jgi:hypothetical protein
MEPKEIKRSYNRQKKEYYSAKLTPEDEMEYLRKYVAQYKNAPTTINKRTMERQLRNVMAKSGVDDAMKMEAKKLMDSVANVTTLPKELKKIETMAEETSMKVKAPETSAPAVALASSESTKMKRGELQKLRKKLLDDIERLRMTVGLPSRSIDRMIRNAETGREATVMKLAQELEKYEAKYTQLMSKPRPKLSKGTLGKSKK